MANIVLDELVLIADLLTEAPPNCLDVFKAVGLETVNLLTLEKNDFIAAISAGPKTSFKATQLWFWIENWRKRNGLTNVSIAAETTTEPQSAENCVIDQQLEAQEIAKDNQSCAGGENRLKKRKPLGVHIDANEGVSEQSNISLGEGDNSTSFKKAAPGRAKLKIEVDNSGVTNAAQVGGNEPKQIYYSPRRLRSLLNESDLVLENEELLTPDSERGLVPIVPIAPIVPAEGFDVEEEHSTTDDIGSYSSEQSQSNLHEQSRSISEAEKVSFIQSFLSEVENEYMQSTSDPATVKREATGINTSQVNGTNHQSSPPRTIKRFKIQDQDVLEPILVPEPANNAEHGQPSTESNPASSVTEKPVQVRASLTNSNDTTGKAHESGENQTPEIQPERSKQSSVPLTPNILRNLLQQSIYGKQVLQNSNSHMLSDSGRKLVVDTVARHHLNQTRKTSSEIVNDLSNVIVQVFQKEKKETYYIPKSGRANPGGKLFSRINYIKQSERKRDRKEAEHVSSETNCEEVVHDPQITSALAWLELNKFPWNTVLAQWEVSFPARRPSLRKYAKANSVIKRFPHLREDHGYQLLDSDYQKLGIGNQTEGCSKWNSLFAPIAKYVFKNAKDPSSKELVRIIQDSQIETDYRLLHTLLALNTVLIPVKAAKGFKPTVATAQADTFLLVKSKRDVLAELDKSIKVYEEQQIPIPPKLIVVGDNITSITGECFVIYKSIVYELQSIVRGVDVLVKLRIILGLPVAKLSKLVWIFTEQFVYSVPSDHGEYLCVNKLIDFLKKQEP